MKTYPLLVSISATFGANGEARAILGPVVFGTDWTVKRIVTTTTSVLESVLNVYFNVESVSSRIDGTYSGNKDVDDAEIPLRTLDKLVFVWQNGTPGAVATVILSGEVQAKGR